MALTKKCSKCRSRQSASQFYPNKGTKDKLGSWCKTCMKNFASSQMGKAYRKSYSQKYLARRRELRAQRYRSDPEYRAKCIKEQHDYREKWPEHARRLSRARYHKNAEANRRHRRNYRRNNLDKVRECNRKLWLNSVNYRISMRIRSDLCARLKRKNAKKLTGALKLLGCSIENFKIYIESKFEPGMTWENWGLKTWHIDHIIPCALFDLTKSEHQRVCFHFSNMQPLWASENLSKNKRVNVAENLKEQ